MSQRNSDALTNNWDEFVFVNFYNRYICIGKKALAI